MDIKRLEQISFIVDELLTDPSVDFKVVNSAGKLASEDKYLYELMVDWMKSTDNYIKGAMKDEILNYTEEVLRRAGL